MKFTSCCVNSRQRNWPANLVNRLQSQLRHCQFYLAFMQRCEPDLKGAKQKETIDAIALDIENIRAAWRFAVEQKLIQEIRQADFSIWYYHEIRGRGQAGERLYREALEGLRERYVRFGLAYIGLCADVGRAGLVQCSPKPVEPEQGPLS